MIPVSYSLRSLLVRKTTTLATVVGIGLVVFVLAAALMLSAGIAKTLGASGRPDFAVVLRKGSDAELTSSIETKDVGLVLAAPGVKRGQSGEPLGGGELVVVITQEKFGTDGGVANVSVRGVADNVFQMRPFVRIVEGRPARPGADEAVIGQRLVGRFAGMRLGDQIPLTQKRPVTIVGVMEAEGSSFESEVWTDIEIVRTAFGRPGMVSSVTVALDDAASFDGFEAQIEHDKQIGLEAQRETVFYEKQSEGTSMVITGIGFVITLFFMAAAIIGAFITMNTAVASRRREIGTMLALGFRGGAVLLAFVIEAVALSLVAAALGIVGAFFLGFAKFSMMNFATWSEIVFSFRLTPQVAVTAIVVGTAMGLLGGIIPAWRASRVKPIDAMRG